jgi:hypothetical protein
MNTRTTYRCGANGSTLPTPSRLLRSANVEDSVDERHNSPIPQTSRWQCMGHDCVKEYCLSFRKHGIASSGYRRHCHPSTVTWAVGCLSSAMVHILFRVPLESSLRHGGTRSADVKAFVCAQKNIFSRRHSNPLRTQVAGTRFLSSARGSTEVRVPSCCEFACPLNAWRTER